MRVLHIIDSLVMGGKERRLLELLKGIQKTDDIECCLVILSNTVQYPYLSDIRIPIYYLERSGKKDIRIFKQLKDICLQFKPQIIHSWESMCSLYVAPIARMLNIRFINAMITNSSKVKFLRSRWLRARLTFPLSNLILANSYAGLSAYKAPKHKSRCIHNGFDFSRLTTIENNPVHLENHGVATPNIVGMVASFDPRKDYVSFIEIAKRLVTQRGDVTFIAIGDGPMLKTCRQMVPPHAVDRILFLGNQNNVESYISLFKVALLLTNPIVHGEGISNAILEYMAIGKPVVATIGGGTDEIIIDDHTGFLVPPGNIDVTCDKIHFLLDHENVAVQMGMAGKQVVAQSFSLKKMTDEHIRAYQACLK